jgi:hypothetical protein
MLKLYLNIKPNRFQKINNNTLLKETMNIIIILLHSNILMKQNKDLNVLFEEMTSRYIVVIEKDYKRRYKRAKDKEFVKDELKKGVDFIIEANSTDEGIGRITSFFWDGYKRGEDFKDIADNIKRFFGADDIKVQISRVEADGKHIPVQFEEKEEENKILKQLALDERKLMKILVSYTAHKEIQKRFDSLFEETENVKDDKEITAKYPVKWTSVKDNKNEFVQLIYGLHKAGYINEGKGEITKITEALANVFDVKLAKGWQSNHSTSIRNASAKYEPAVFRKIQEAYKKHMTEIIEDKKKNK